MGPARARLRAAEGPAQTRPPRAPAPAHRAAHRAGATPGRIMAVVALCAVFLSFVGRAPRVLGSQRAGAAGRKGGRAGRAVRCGRPRARARAGRRGSPKGRLLQFCRQRPRRRRRGGKVSKHPGPGPPRRRPLRQCCHHLCGGTHPQAVKAGSRAARALRRVNKTRREVACQPRIEPKLRSGNSPRSPKPLPTPGRAADWRPNLRLQCCCDKAAAPAA